MPTLIVWGLSLLAAASVGAFAGAQVDDGLEATFEPKTSIPIVPIALIGLTALAAHRLLKNS